MHVGNGKAGSHMGAGGQNAIAGRLIKDGKSGPQQSHQHWSFDDDACCRATLGGLDGLFLWNLCLFLGSSMGLWDPEN